MPLRANNDPARRGFSLVELIATMVILGALALTATPALRSVTSAREGAMARRLVRMLEYARARATATGEPTGLVYDADDSAFLLRRIATDGGAPVPVPGPLGTDQADLGIETEYPSVAVTVFTTGDGDPAHTCVWFDHEGGPHIRGDDGSLIAAFTQDTVITTTGPHSVTVRMTTGAIE